MLHPTLTADIAKRRADARSERAVWLPTPAVELAGIALWLVIAVVAAMTIGKKHALAVALVGLAASAIVALSWLRRLVRYLHAEGDEYRKCAVGLTLTGVLLAGEVGVGHAWPRELGVRLVLGSCAAAMCVLSARLLVCSQARFIRLHRRRTGRRLALGLAIAAVGSLTLALQLSQFLGMLGRGPGVLVYLLLAYESVALVWAAAMIALGLGVAKGEESRRALALRRERRRRRRFEQSRRRRMAWLYDLEAGRQREWVEQRVLGGRRMLVARPAPTHHGVVLLVALMGMSVGLNILARALVEGGGRLGLLAGAMVGLGLMMAASAGRSRNSSRLFSDQGAYWVLGRREAVFLWDELREIQFHRPWIGSWRWVFVRDRDGAEFTIKLHELEDAEAVVRFLEQGAGFPPELIVRRPRRGLGLGGDAAPGALGLGGVSVA